MVKVKICGITNLEDALNAVNAGCDALGFLFYKKSPRYISPNTADGVVRYVPKKVLRIGVFVDEKEKTIKEIATRLNLDILQFHGDESPEFCSKFKGYKIIKVFRVDKQFDIKKILKYKVFAYLFDTYSKAKKGGTGKTFNWKFLTSLNIKQSIFLSGGLSENNVEEAIKIVKPNWIDASTSLEASPGKKDQKKVKNFIKIVKRLGG